MRRRAPLRAGAGAGTGFGFGLLDLWCGDVVGLLSLRGLGGRWRAREGWWGAGAGGWGT